jgi:hypothetical protein
MKIFFWKGFTRLRPALAALRRGRQDSADIVVFSLSEILGKL